MAGVMTSGVDDAVVAVVVGESCETLGGVVVVASGDRGCEIEILRALRAARVRAGEIEEVKVSGDRDHAVPATSDITHSSSEDPAERLDVSAERLKSEIARPSLGDVDEVEPAVRAGVEERNGARPRSMNPVQLGPRHHPADGVIVFVGHSVSRWAAR